VSHFAKCSIRHVWILLALACAAAARASDLPAPVGVPVVLESKISGDVVWVQLDGDGADLIQIDRKYLASSSVAIVTPQKAGAYRMQALGIAEGKPAYEIFRLQVGPGPGPQPGPTPTPPPLPPIAKLHVLLIEESADRPRLPASQLAALTSPEVRTYLDTKCGKDGWRLLDKDTDVTAASEWWRKAMTLPRTSLPWIIISSATQVYSGPLPRTAAELLALLKQHGG